MNKLATVPSLLVLLVMAAVVVTATAQHCRDDWNQSGRVPVETSALDVDVASSLESILIQLLDDPTTDSAAVAAHMGPASINWHITEVAGDVPVQISMTPPQLVQPFVSEQQLRFAYDKNAPDWPESGQEVGIEIIVPAGKLQKIAIQTDRHSISIHLEDSVDHTVYVEDVGIGNHLQITASSSATTTNTASSSVALTSAGLDGEYTVMVPSIQRLDISGSGATASLRGRIVHADITGLSNTLLLQGSISTVQNFDLSNWLMINEGSCQNEHFQEACEETTQQVTLPDRVPCTVYALENFSREEQSIADLRGKAQ